MPALIAPVRVACAPMPFLLEDQFDAYGQLVVVPDENWEYMIDWVKQELLLPGREPTIIETEKGPFMQIRDEDIDQEKRAMP